MDPWVTLSVANMSTTRLPYADAETPRAMAGDCLEAGANLRLPGQRPTGDLFADLFADSGPSFADAVSVPDDLARRAGDLQLHFD